MVPAHAQQALWDLCMPQSTLIHHNGQGHPPLGMAPWVGSVPAPRSLWLTVFCPLVAGSGMEKKSGGSDGAPGPALGAGMLRPSLPGTCCAASGRVALPCRADVTEGCLDSEPGAA